MEASVAKPFNGIAHRVLLRLGHQLISPGNESPRCRRIAALHTRGAFMSNDDESGAVCSIVQFDSIDRQNRAH